MGIDPKHQYIASIPVFAHAAMPSVISSIYQGIKGVVGGLDDTMRGQIYERTS